MRHQKKEEKKKKRNLSESMAHCVKIIFVEVLSQKYTSDISTFQHTQV